MAERASFRSIYLVLVAALTATVLHCGNDSQTHYGSSRELDDLCKSDHCTTKGSGRVVRGPTDDSVGLQLGPAPGEVHVPVSAEPVASGDDVTELEVLVRGGAYDVSSCGGSFGCEGPERHRATSEYEWTTVHGSGRELVFTAVEGQTIDIADIRHVSAKSPPSCNGGT